jgi:hypothetical protein
MISLKRMQGEKSFRQFIADVENKMKWIRLKTIYSPPAILDVWK